MLIIMEGIALPTSRHLALALALVGALVLAGYVTPARAGSTRPVPTPQAGGRVGGGAAPAPPPPSATARARATPRGTPGTPPVGVPCGAAQATPIVADFLAAFNRGDQVALARFFPEQGFDPTDPCNVDRLEVFSLDAADPSAGIDHRNLHTRPTLLAYFAARQRQHEQIRLLALQPLAPQGPIVGFGFTRCRRATPRPDRAHRGEPERARARRDGHPRASDGAQRRTFAELPHPHPLVGGRIALASCLALLHGTAQETLVLFEAMRPTGAADWGPGGNLTTMAVDARRRPFTAVGSIIPRTGLNVGVLIAAPDVAAVRIELADGTSVEDTPSRRSIQVVALFRSPAAWAGDATVRVLDSAGKELATQRLAMSPGGRPG